MTLVVCLIGSVLMLEIVLLIDIFYLQDRITRVQNSLNRIEDKLDTIQFSANRLENNLIGR